MALNWVLKNWCFWTVVLEKTLESPLDCKEIQQVNSKGNQSWIFIGRTAAEAETPILWSPVAKNWLIWKDPEAEKDWRQEEKGTGGEDEMVGWHHWLNGHEFKQALVVGDGQGSLACYCPWCCKESDRTEQLNWTELKWRRMGEKREEIGDLVSWDSSLLLPAVKFLSLNMSIVSWKLLFYPCPSLFGFPSIVCICTLYPRFWDAIFVNREWLEEFLNAYYKKWLYSLCRPGPLN